MFSFSETGGYSFVECSFAFNSAVSALYLKFREAVKRNVYGSVCDDYAETLLSMLDNGDITAKQLVCYKTKSERWVCFLIGLESVLRWGCFVGSIILAIASLICLYTGNIGRWCFFLFSPVLIYWVIMGLFLIIYKIQLFLLFKNYWVSVDAGRNFWNAIKTVVLNRSKNKIYSAIEKSLAP